LVFGIGVNIIFFFLRKICK